MDKEIRKITIIAGTGTRTIEVGFGGVCCIKDNSVEVGDTLLLRYVVYDESEKLMTTIESCPVVVDFK